MINIATEREKSRLKRVYLSMYGGLGLQPADTPLLFVRIFPNHLQTVFQNLRICQHQTVFRKQDVPEQAQFHPDFHLEVLLVVE
jgi:hypothetical protein